MKTTHTLHPMFTEEDVELLLQATGSGIILAQAPAAPHEHVKPRRGQSPYEAEIAAKLGQVGAGALAAPAFKL